MIRLKDLLADALQEPNTFCAWCNKAIKFTPGLKPGELSHGICKPCAKKHMGIELEAALDSPENKKKGEPLGANAEEADLEKLVLPTGPKKPPIGTRMSAVGPYDSGIAG